MFQSHQGVQVIDKEHPQHARAGRVVGDDGKTVKVLLDGDTESTEFQHPAVEQQLRIL